MSSTAKQAIVTPIFEDREASMCLFQDLAKTLGHDVYIVAVDDGSVRHPVSPQWIEQAGLKGVVLRLNRNLGHQRAIAAGLCYVSEHLPDAHCIVMDSDGEDQPSAIPELLSTLDDPSVDIAVAARKSRIASATFKLFYYFYTRFFRIMTGRHISFGNFMALTPRAVKRLCNMQEIWIHVAACVLVSNLRIKIRKLDRGARYAGQSKMNFASLTLHGLRAFMVFAEDVLVRVGIACAAIATLSLIGIALSISFKAIGIATPGWASVVLGILVLVLMQTGALTLMSLMMTGIVRDRSMVSVDYNVLIDEVLVAK
jgi:glycosyltransferase involved in cell wall biosynthesis